MDGNLRLEIELGLVDGLTIWILSWWRVVDKWENGGDLLMSYGLGYFERRLRVNWEIGEVVLVLNLGL